MFNDDDDDAVRTDGVDVTTLARWFEDAFEATDAERRDAERDRDYYDGKQLTAAEVAALRQRGQPPIVVNRIRRKIDLLRGIEIQQRSDPKAYPRTPARDDAAAAATDALRYVADTVDLRRVRSGLWENLLIEGFGGAEVVVEAVEPTPAEQAAATLPVGKRQQIRVNLIPWDRLVRDPYAREPDCSDAKYVGIVLWLDFEEVAERWPDATDTLSGAFDGAYGDTFDDRPAWRCWSDGKRRRIRVVQMWHRRAGTWWFATFTKGLILEQGRSPYHDETGASVCPIIAQSAYVDRENRRYGVVREMIDVQDEINKRRSKMLHLLNARQTYSNAQSVGDVDQLKAELAKPDGHLEFMIGDYGKDFGIIPTSDLSAGQFQLLQEAKAEIDLMGPNAAIAGKDPRDQSGRAIIAQQQGGYIELGPLMDLLRDWDVRVYRAIWQRIRQFWTDERWIRVTDDGADARFVALNQPVAHPQTGQRMIRNAIAELDVDIIVDDAPDAVSIQSEQFQLLVSLVQAGVPIPPDVLIAASQLRGKAALLKRLGAAGGLADQAQTLKTEGELADIRAKQAKAARDEAVAYATTTRAGETGA